MSSLRGSRSVSSKTRVTTCSGEFWVLAACCSKGLEYVYEETQENDDAVNKEMASLVDNAAEAGSCAWSPKEMRKHTRNMVVWAFGDHELRVMRAVLGHPRDILRKLDLIYDSKETARKILRMV